MAKLPANKAARPANTAAEVETPQPAVVVPETPVENKTTEAPAPAEKPAEAKEEPTKAAPKTATKPAAKPAVKNLAPKASDADTTRINRAAAKSLGGVSFAKLEDTTDYAKVIFWGREGSSKTTSACHAANLGRVLVINIEGGLKTQALKRQGVNVDNLAVWPNPDDADAEISHQALEAVYFQIKADLMKDPGSWFAVIIDSISDLADTIVGRVSDNRVNRAIKRAEQQGVDLDENSRWETDRNDYGVMGKQFRDLLRKFRDLPCHLILTALERRDVDEDTGLVMYGPAVSPGLQKDVLGYMDLVFYFKEAEDATKDTLAKPYRAVTQRAGRRRSKDRYGVMPQVFNEPTFERLVGYLNGELTADTDPLQTAVTK